MKGRVFLVGAGPGDPELLTLKASRLLQTADVVLYDELVSPEILKLTSPTADRNTSNLNVSPVATPYSTGCPFFSTLPARQNLGSIPI